MHVTYRLPLTYFAEYISLYYTNSLTHPRKAYISYIKLHLLEEVDYIAIFNFYVKGLIPTDATLFIQNNFYQNYKKLLVLYLYNNFTSKISSFKSFKMFNMILNPISFCTCLYISKNRIRKFTKMGGGGVWNVADLAPGRGWGGCLQYNSGMFSFVFFVSF